MDEENLILKHWRQQEIIFTDNLHISRKKPTKDSVHDLRVAVKKMRSYLRLKKEINKEEWKELFSKIIALFKSFGRLRDFDMSLELLKKHNERLSFPFFKDYLLANKALSRKWAKENALMFNEEEPTPFNQQFISLQKQLPSGEICEKIIFLSRKRIKEVQELETDFHSNVHQIRKILKDVYYWIQICPKGSSGNIIDQKALDKMLNYLGSWQDNFILGQKMKRYRKDIANNTEKKCIKDFEKKLVEENKELVENARSKWKEALR